MFESLRFRQRRVKRRIHPVILDSYSFVIMLLYDTFPESFRVSILHLTNMNMKNQIGAMIRICRSHHGFGLVL
ncbi:hypothetical protein DERP_011391 [Dermatophagoides pteronyssinus]|uniref:Uncharacterized protein n=1 Tax=Dermatophagoides pteronyssinus TaxID=6956 RepID=A0ABQ8J561_DERPT|nr:hypothetical protein DERP_011391 [Dermatophagoides pteronyssinus]